jgi:uncharacterized protein YndB with AHSA1/START domain
VKKTGFRNSTFQQEASMADIFHDLPIKAPIDKVFRAISTPEGLDGWWAKSSTGKPEQGAEYELSFGPEYNWLARVTRCVAPVEFELQLVQADHDWTGSRVKFVLETRGKITWLRFLHTGWPSANEHYRISCNCWAMYLRILRRSLEHGESVPYEERLDV